MEHSFQCVYCWSQISMLLDTSVPSQVYIEDCEVCCRPIKISVQFTEGEIHFFEAKSIEQ
ncbi:CPXCG motif-containing cysteine-rich protein [Flavobacteriaceae bacterium F08102]|nr:CPXCG motif-containing cysteine-rich protein [Flavobacteriaceae bacterium F08102]